MTDKDILISDLNDISEILNDNGYGGWCATIRKAIALLKEQEAVEPDVDSEGTCTCRNCGENVGWYPAGCKTPVRLGKFCSNCGHEVKWND